MDDPRDEFLAEEPPALEDQEGPGLFDELLDYSMRDAPTAPARPAAEGSTAAAQREAPSAQAAPQPQTPPVTAAAQREAPPAPDLVAPPLAPPRTRPESPEPPLALYRRYRPETFAEVIGQEHVTEPLQRALVNNRVNHAYLFSGPRGCGKTTSARILARALNCAQGPTPVPCGECDSCVALARGGTGSVDVIEIDAASHGGVNEARDLRERAFFSPVASRYKVYIIDEAHMVTKEGFNALLKVVEEPPPHVKFIFATTEPDKVLGTIRSRTHHYPFRLLPPKLLGEYLHEVCRSEGVAVEPSVIPLVVRAGAGSVRDSLSVLDQLLGAATTSGVSYAQAAALLGFTPDSLLDEVVDAFAAGDAAGVFAAVDKVIEVGQDPRRFAEDLLRRLRDLVIVAAVPDALSTGLIDVPPDTAERLRTQAAGMGAGELTRAAEVMATGLTEMRGTTAPRLHLELICARVLLPGADVDGRGLHARLDRLERRSGMVAGAVHTDAPSGPVGVPSPEHPERGRARPSPGTAAHETDGAPGPDDGAPVDPGSQRSGTPALEASHPPPPGPPSAQSGARYPEQPESRATPSSNVVSLDSVRRSHAPSSWALTTAELRDRWPEVLAEVKARRRFTWMLLSQNAQVLDVAENVLTLGISNVGARDAFSRRGSEEVLRDAIVYVLGVDLQIYVAVDAQSPGRPPAAEPTASVQAPQRRPDGAERARQEIQPTRFDPVPPGTAPPDDEFDPDDPNAEEVEESSDELITKHLGAQLIAEDDADPDTI